MLSLLKLVPKCGHLNLGSPQSLGTVSNHEIIGVGFHSLEDSPTTLL